MRNQTCFYSVQNAAIPPHYCPIFMVIAKSLIDGVGDSCTHRDCQSANAQSMKVHWATTLGKKMPSMIKYICKCNWINVCKFWLICAIFFDMHRFRCHMANNNITYNLHPNFAARIIPLHFWKIFVFAWILRLKFHHLNFAARSVWVDFFGFNAPLVHSTTLQIPEFKVYRLLLNSSMHQFTDKIIMEKSN